MQTLSFVGPQNYFAFVVQNIHIYLSLPKSDNELNNFEQSRTVICLCLLFSHLLYPSLVSECMPPRKDFKPPASPLTPQFSLNAEPKPLIEKRPLDHAGNSATASSAVPNSIVKNHPLKRRQVQSLDERNMPEAEKSSSSGRSESAKTVRV